jgi:hypothetical protein
VIIAVQVDRPINHDDDVRRTMPAAITTQSIAEIGGCLTSLGVWSHGIGGELLANYQKFYASSMKTLAGSTSNTNRVRKTRKGTATPETQTKRGRKPAAQKAQTKGKSGVGTQDLADYITVHPGVTQPALRDVFPTLAVNVLGRMLSSAMKTTKARPTALITLRGDGYYPAAATRQREAA